MKTPRSLLALSAVLTSATACSREPAATPADAAVDRPTDIVAPRDVQPLPPYVDPYACSASSAPLPLDESLDAAQTRAGAVRDPAELIGGEGASGAVGHFKLYNSRVRFIVQGRVEPRPGARAIGYDLYGGNLIDADRVRPRGTPGQDVFHEMFGLYGYRVSSVEEVAVACDGSNGRPAAIRVVGVDRPSRILGNIDALARDRDTRIVTHYILRPNSDVLEIRTEVQSNVGAAIRSVPTGDFLGFGAALTLFSAATGFGSLTRATEPIQWLAGVTDPGENNRHVSYAIAAQSGPVTVPIVDASGTAALYDNVSAPEGASAQFVRYFSVGSGDATSAIEPLMALRHDPFGTVTGTTTPGALVYAYRDRYAADAPVRSVARAEASGAYRLALSPGSYALVAVDAGRVRGAPVSVTVTDGAEAHANPTAGPTGTLVLDVALTAADGTRVRAPLKISLAGVDVEAPDPGMGELEGEREGYGQHRVIYSVTGIERVTVKPGRYRALLSHGDEYATREVMVTVTAGGEATLAGDLARAVETTGYVSADFHQHTVGSIDSGRALCNRVIEDIAEGLEYASTTDHDNVTDFAPCTQQLGLGAWFNSIRGNEISVIGVGHFNAYPLVPEAGDPMRLVGAQYWADQTAQQLFDRVRAESSDPILHVSHPRSNGFKGYFTSIALDPVRMRSRDPLARGWEAMEVNESFGAPEEYLASNDAALSELAQRDPSRVATMHDWFGLLSRGEHTAALGNSDTHGRNNGSGWPHNLLRVGTDAPAMVTPALVRSAIRAQRVVISNGIVVRVRVAGVERMGHTEVVTAGAEGVDLELDVQAAPWVTARDVAVFENGRPLALTPDGRGGWNAVVATENRGLTVPLMAGAVTRLRGAVHVRPTQDAYYVVLARGASLSPVGSGEAFGYTNPVYVDVGTSGWQPPIAP